MFTFINNLTGQNIVIDTIGIFSAVWLVWLLAGSYVVAVNQQIFVSKYWHIFSLALIMGLIYAVSFIIGYVWFEPRPFVAGHAKLLISLPNTMKSFPSDHTAIAFSLAVAFWHLKVKHWPWAFVAAVFVAMGRVFVGVHYWQDVVAGAILGSGLSWLIYKLFDRYFGKLRRAIL